MVKNSSPGRKDGERGDGDRYETDRAGGPSLPGLPRLARPFYLSFHGLPHVLVSQLLLFPPSPSEHNYERGPPKVPFGVGPRENFDI